MRALMSHRLLAFLVGVCTAVTAAAAQPAQEALGPKLPAHELLKNGGFEAVDNAGSPVAWHATWAQLPGVEFTLAKGNNARSGKHSLRLKSATTPARLRVFNGPIDVTSVAGGEVILSFVYRIVGAPSAAVQFVTYKESFVEDEQRTPYLTAESKPLPAVRAWSLVSWRLRCPEVAREAVALFELYSEGELIIDNASLRPVGASPITFQPELLGELTGYPQRREVRAKIVNASPERRTVGVTVQGMGERLKLARTMNVAVDGRDETEIRVPYNYPADKGHQLQVCVEDLEGLTVYDTLVAEVPPLISGRAVSPPYRATLFSSVPVDEIVVGGRINAPDNIAEALTLTADLGGAGVIARDGEGLERPDGPGSWSVVVPREGMLTGRYRLVITAHAGPRLIASSAFELIRAPESKQEISVDEQGRLLKTGQPTFVNGLYNVTNEERLQTVADHGFNLVITPTRSAGRDFSSRANELGMMAVIYSAHAPIKGTGPDLTFWEHTVSKYVRIEHLIGWHLLSKPDAAGMPVAEFIAQQRELSAVDPYHPTITLLTYPSRFADFMPWCDVVAVQSQPVPALPVTAVIDDLADAQALAEPGQPVWAAIQAVGRAWHVTGGGMQHGDSGRPPTAGEHRAMTMLALAHGAQGLLHHGFYFAAAANRDPYFLPADAPELWEGMKETNALVHQIAPAIVGGAYRGCEVTGQLHVAAWDLKGVTYVLAANSRPSISLSTFAVPGPRPEALWRVSGGANVPCTGEGLFADDVPAYGARVYTSAEPEGDTGDSAQ